MKPVIEVGGARVFAGDCREVLKGLPDNSVDSIVTDPPYELGFMGKKWDSSGIAYDVTVWAECLRVLKPGGHILAFGGSRTWHRLAVAVEDAGFEIRDNIAWIYGSGFPKSLDVSKAIDKRGGSGALLTKEIGEALRVARESRGMSKSKADEIFCDGTTNWTWFEGRPAGQRPPTPETFARIVAEWPELSELSEKVAEAEREVIGMGAAQCSQLEKTGVCDGHFDNGTLMVKHQLATKSATSEAKTWEGWGTALKPAHEPIVVGRKPLVGTVAENVLEWGVGGLNIDRSRIGNESRVNQKSSSLGNGHTMSGGKAQDDYPDIHVTGRWPANVIFDEVTARLLDKQTGVLKSGKMLPTHTTAERAVFGQNAEGGYTTSETYGDSGGASRFFYVAKASKRDRNEGLEELNSTTASDRPGDVNSIVTRHSTITKNFHPTVKPTALMRYLIKLVTPPGGTVLDPFTGSGSTGKAALLDGFQFVGVELTEEYLPIIEGRLRWATEQGDDDDTLF
jgi:DNA modification methylase